MNRRQKVSSYCNKLGKACTRKKLVGQKHEGDDQLIRCLGKFRATTIGVGTTIGSGIYIVTGTLLHSVSGPGVILSYLISGLAATLSALCYAEFGARVPKVGSAYAYCYVALGELGAFIAGWNMIFEWIVGASGCAIATASYLDGMCGFVLRNFSISLVGGDPVFAPGADIPWYPNIGALVLLTLVSVNVALGIQLNSHVTTLFVGINVLTAAVVIGYGSTLVDFSLWSPFYAEGTGFLPFGLSGMISGASMAFWSYCGFDGVCNLVEEMIDPHTTLPFSLIATLIIATTWYVLMSGVLSLLIPFNLIHEATAYADAFYYHHVHWVATVVSIGAAASMFCTLMCICIPIPRAIYAMSRDHLLHPWLGHINQRTQVAVRAVFFAFITMVVFVLLFELHELVEMLAVGTLLAYSLVAASVIVLRYRPVDHQIPLAVTNEEVERKATEILAPDQLPSADDLSRPTDCARHLKSDWLLKVAPCVADWSIEWMANRLLGVSILTMGAICVSIRLSSILPESLLAISLTVFPIILILCLATFAGMKPAPQEDVSFMVPFSPWIPLSAIQVNLFFMAFLNPLTWVRFTIVTFIGILIYVFYGASHSRLNLNLDVTYSMDEDGYEELP